MLAITHIYLKRRARRSHSKFQSLILTKDEKVMPIFALWLTLKPHLLPKNSSEPSSRLQISQNRALQPFYAICGHSEPHPYLPALFGLLGPHSSPLGTLRLTFRPKFETLANDFSTFNLRKLRSFTSGASLVRFKLCNLL